MSTPIRPPRTAPPKLTHRTGRRGVAQFEERIAELGWDFDEQSTIDFGIDGSVETADQDGRPSGALVSVQIKGGLSEFDEPSDNGWWFRFADRHYRYWMKYCLPVYVVLVDIDTREFFWQRVSADNVVSTGKQWKIEIPRNNDSTAAYTSWHLEAGGFLDEAVERAALVADLIPPAARAALGRLTATPDVVALLTAMLGGSAGAPELVVQALLTATPQWLKEAPGCAWEVVAAYASEHGLLDLAGSAFERGAEHDPEHAVGCLIAAASNYIDCDRDRARATLTGVKPVEPRHRLSVGLVRASIEHPPGDAHPIEVPPDLLADAHLLRDHAMAQAWLGGNAIRRGDFDHAITHLSRALELDPASTQTMLQLSEAHTRRALTARSRPDDVTLAQRLADDAYRQRRSWKGPSAEALVQVLSTLMLRGDEHELLRRGREAPHGVATPDEAVDPEVLERVAVAALLLGDADAFRECMTAMPDTARRAWLELDAPDAVDEPEGLSEGERIEAVLNRAVSEDDAHTVARTVLRLSHLGIDRTDAIAPLRDVGVVPELHVRLPQAILAAQCNLDEALPELRALAQDDAVAADVLVHQLGQAGRYDQALAELDALPPALRVSEHSLRVGTLLDAGRSELAEAAAVDALTDTSLTGRERQRLYRLLAAAAGRRDEPDKVITWCRRALAGLLTYEADATIVWWLISSCLNVGRNEQAWQAFEHYAPRPQTDEEVGVWRTLHQLHGWSADAMHQALELAQTWAEDALISAQLLGAICLTPDDEEGSDPDSEREARRVVRQQAFAELQQHCDRHGDASPIQCVTVSPDDREGMVEMFRASLAEQALVHHEVLLAVRQLQVPLGLLSDAVGSPYALAVVQRAAGMTIAAEPDASLFDLEVIEVAAALTAHGGRPLVTDASAIHLSGRLGVQDVVRRAFPRWQLPRASWHDIQRSLLEARQLQRSLGSMQWDTVGDRPVMIEVSPEDQNEILKRAEILEVASRSCEIVVEGPLRLFNGEDGTDDTAHSDEKRDADVTSNDGADPNSAESAAWLAPLQHAADTGAALWSDDVVLRRIARSVGVATFGTLAVLHALHEHAQIQLDEAWQEDLTQRLLAEWVIDGPWSAAQTVQRAQHPDAPLDVLLAVLTRPWRYTDEDERRAALQAVTGTIDHDPTVHRRWFTAVSLGLASAAKDPARAALLMAAQLAADDPDSPARFATYVGWLRELFSGTHPELDLGAGLDSVLALLAGSTGIPASTFAAALQAP